MESNYFSFNCSFNLLHDAINTLKEQYNVFIILQINYNLKLNMSRVQKYKESLYRFIKDKSCLFDNSLDEELSTYIEMGHLESKVNLLIKV